MTQMSSVLSKEINNKKNQETKTKKEEQEKLIRKEYFKNIFNKRLKERLKFVSRTPKKLPDEKKITIKNRPLIAQKKAQKSQVNLLINDPRPEAQIQSGNMIARLTEINTSVVAQAQATGLIMDEINKLIKKMTLSFSISKNDSSFFINDGLFAGAHFQLNKDKQNLTMNVKNGTESAYQVLGYHQDLLKHKLRKNEINLENIMFS